MIRRHHFHERGHKSVFMRLLFVLILTGFFLFLLVGVFFKLIFDSSAHETLQKNIFNYANYIIQDIGIPPDTLRAKEIAREYSIGIRYESSSFTWATSDEIPSIENVQQRFHKIPKHNPRWWAHETIS